jgi:hypothetical protein
MIARSVIIVREMIAHSATTVRVMTVHSATTAQIVVASGIDARAMIVPVVEAGLKVAPTAGQIAQAGRIAQGGLIVQAVVVIGHNAVLAAETVQEGRAVADPRLRSRNWGKSSRPEHRLAHSWGMSARIHGLS